MGVSCFAHFGEGESTPSLGILVKEACSQKGVFGGQSVFHQVIAQHPLILPTEAPFICVFQSCPTPMATLHEAC